MRRALPLFILLSVFIFCSTARAEELSIRQDYSAWREHPAQHSPTPLPADLNGRTVVLRWNGKHNSDKLLTRLHEHLQRAFPTARFVFSHAVNPDLSRVPPSIEGARAHVQGLLALSPAVVITATGDCRSCVAWLAVEQVLLEEQGVATVALLTNPFRKVFQTMHRNLHMDELPCVVVPHPVANLPAEKVQDKADAAAAELLRLLVK